MFTTVPQYYFFLKKWRFRVLVVGNILKEFHISAYIQVIYLKSKIYRTLKKYLSFKEKWTFSLKSKYLYQLLFLVLFPTFYLCMCLYQVMGTNQLSKQLQKICLCWKCWQFYLSINIHWKSGDSEFSWIYKGLFNSQNKLCGSKQCGFWKEIFFKTSLVKFYICWK